jgi:hypothetical protein
MKKSCLVGSMFRNGVLKDQVTILLAVVCSCLELRTCTVTYKTKARNVRAFIKDMNGCYTLTRINTLYCSDRS